MRKNLFALHPSTTRFQTIFGLWIASANKVAQAVPKMAHFCTAWHFAATGWVKVRCFYSAYAPRYPALHPQPTGILLSGVFAFSTLSTRPIKETTKYIN